MKYTSVLRNTQFCMFNLIFFKAMRSVISVIYLHFHSAKHDFEEPAALLFLRFFLSQSLIKDDTPYPYPYPVVSFQLHFG